MSLGLAYVLYEVIISFTSHIPHLFKLFQTGLSFLLLLNTKEEILNNAVTKQCVVFGGTIPLNVSLNSNDLLGLILSVR